ncbi:hypothetical protein Micbo1qcDRAFT_159832 [Microdochium bolleyi]|uniref:Uncharacterized protein n=1 Tax=Microdochium bolleyi TaxID=196109 RepID=A0A136JC25_9PEZI|nr:hypothetical protein Micbo1qcDRAFT_159832 [Microdochium bolleyi]
MARPAPRQITLKSNKPAIISRVTIRCATGTAFRVRYLTSRWCDETRFLVWCLWERLSSKGSGSNQGTHANLVYIVVGLFESLFREQRTKTPRWKYQQGPSRPCGSDETRVPGIPEAPRAISYQLSVAGNRVRLPHLSRAGVLVRTTCVQMIVLSTLMSSCVPGWQMNLSG